MDERIASLLATRADKQMEAAKHYAAACCYPGSASIVGELAQKALRGEALWRCALPPRRKPCASGLLDEDREFRIQFIKEMICCARNCGCLDCAGERLRELLEIADLAKDQEQQAEAHHQLADLALLNLDYTAARTHLQAAAEPRGEREDEEEAVRRWFALASFLADQIRPKESHRVLTRALTLLARRDAPALRSSC